jgi:hypothetical protein
MFRNHVLPVDVSSIKYFVTELASKACVNALALAPMPVHVAVVGEGIEAFRALEFLPAVTGEHSGLLLLAMGPQTSVYCNTASSSHLLYYHDLYHLKLQSLKKPNNMLW